MQHFVDLISTEMDPERRPIRERIRIVVQTTDYGHVLSSSFPAVAPCPRAGCLTVSEPGLSSHLNETVTLYPPCRQTILIPVDVSLNATVIWRAVLGFVGVVTDAVVPAGWGARLRIVVERIGVEAKQSRFVFLRALGRVEDW